MAEVETQTASLEYLKMIELDREKYEREIASLREKLKIVRKERRAN